MKRFPGFVIASAFLVFPFASEAQDISSLSWLSGCWIQDDGVKRIDETWLPPAGGVMIGVGRTVKSGSLRNYEFMRIAPVDGKLTFTANPSGQGEASFPVISHGDAEITFENTAHDFPQRISYRRLAADHIQAVIAGPAGGTTKTISFDYTRCR